MKKFSQPFESSSESSISQKSPENSNKSKIEKNQRITKISTLQKDIDRVLDHNRGNASIAMEKYEKEYQDLKNNNTKAFNKNGTIKDVSLLGEEKPYLDTVCQSMQTIYNDLRAAVANRDKSAESLEPDIKSQSYKNIDYSNNIANLKKEVKTKTLQYQNAEMRIQKLNQQVNDIQDDYVEKVLEVVQLTEQHDNAQKQIEELTERLENAQKQIDDLTEQCDEAQKQIDKLTQQLEKEQNQGKDSIEKEIFEKEQKQHSEEIAKLTESLDQLQKQLEQKEEQLQGINKQLNELVESNVEKDVKLIELNNTKTDLDQLQTQIKEMEAKTEPTAQDNEELERLRTNYKKLEDKYNDAVDAVEILGEKAKIRGKILKKRHIEMNELDEQLKACMDSIGIDLGDDSQSGQRIALAKRLRNSVNNVSRMLEDQDQKIQALEDEVDCHLREGEKLLGENMKLLESIESLFKASVDPEKSVRGGRVYSSIGEKKAAAVYQSIKDYKQWIEQLTKERDKLQKQVEEQLERGNKQQIEAEGVGPNKQIAEENTEIENLKKKIAALTDKKEMKDKTRQKIITDLQTQVADKDTQIIGLKAEVADKDTQITELQKQVDKLKQTNERQKVDDTQLDAQTEDLSVKTTIADLNPQIADKNDEIEELNKTVEDYVNAWDKSEDVIANLENKNRELECKNRESEEEKQELMKENQALQKELENIRQREIERFEQYQNALMTGDVLKEQQKVDQELVQENSVEKNDETNSFANGNQELQKNNDKQIEDLNQKKNNLVEANKLIKEEKIKSENAIKTVAESVESLLAQTENAKGFTPPANYRHKAWVDSSARFLMDKLDKCNILLQRMRKNNEADDALGNKVATAMADMSQLLAIEVALNKEMESKTEAIKLGNDYINNIISETDIDLSEITDQKDEKLREEFNKELNDFQTLLDRYKEDKISVETKELEHAKSEVNTIIDFLANSQRDDASFYSIYDMGKEKQLDVWKNYESKRPKLREELIEQLQRVHHFISLPDVAITARRILFELNMPDYLNKNNELLKTVMEKYTATQYEQKRQQSWKGNIEKLDVKYKANEKEITRLDQEINKLQQS